MTRIWLTNGFQPRSIHSPRALSAGLRCGEGDRKGSGSRSSGVGTGEVESGTMGAFGDVTGDNSRSSTTSGLCLERGCRLRTFGGLNSSPQLVCSASASLGRWPRRRSINFRATARSSPPVTVFLLNTFLGSGGGVVEGVSDGP